MALNAKGAYDGVAVSFQRLKLDNVCQVDLAGSAEGVDGGPVHVQLAARLDLVQQVGDKLAKGRNGLFFGPGLSSSLAFVVVPSISLEDFLLEWVVHRAWHGAGNLVSVARQEPLQGMPGNEEGYAVALVHG